MDYESWVATVPEEIRRDSLWKMKAYRLGLFAADVGWHDVTKLVQDRRTLRLSDQLYRALGSISANLSEGYSRGTGRDLARFYEYALGSARESRDWYHKGRHILGETVTQHRLRYLTDIIRLPLTMIPQQRGRVLSEESAAYTTGLDNRPLLPSEDPEEEALDGLLANVPLP